MNLRSITRQELKGIFYIHEGKSALKNVEACLIEKREKEISQRISNTSTKPIIKTLLLNELADLHSLKNSLASLEQFCKVENISDENCETKSSDEDTTLNSEEMLSLQQHIKKLSVFISNQKISIGAAASSLTSNLNSRPAQVAPILEDSELWIIDSKYKTLNEVHSILIALEKLFPSKKNQQNSDLSETMATLGEDAVQQKTANLSNSPASILRRIHHYRSSTLLRSYSSPETNNSLDNVRQNGDPAPFSPSPSSGI